MYEYIVDYPNGVIVAVVVAQPLLVEEILVRKLMLISCIISLIKHQI